MNQIAPGKYVELVYDLYEVRPDGSGKLVHQSDAADPERIVFGVTPGVIVPLERAIEGCGVGDTFDVLVKADEAFGPHDPDQVVELDRDIFVVDGKFDSDMIKVGAVVPMMTSEGYHINGIVLNVGADKVKMDFNHPLAGKDVRFTGRIVTVRDATPEELQPAHGCGCGCGHHDGDCSGGDCSCESHDCGCGGCH